MIFAHQKPKHCFVACCASLLGKSDVASQEAIVNQFPADLQKGTSDEGVPQTSTEANNVLMGLGLSKQPHWVESMTPSFTPLSDLLRGNKQLKERALIATKHPTNHCIGIKEIHDDKLTVMDPEKSDFDDITYQEFESRRPVLIIL
jgi:hypothetical protein